jgi:predicted phosphodiesterase
MKIALFSDVHGHLRIVLHLIRNWQMAHQTRLDAGLVAGDLGVFPDLAKLDKATRHWMETDLEQAGFSQFFTQPQQTVDACSDLNTVASRM